MKSFFCSHCGTQVFFQNDRCGTCGKSLGFALDSMNVDAFEPQADGRWLRSTKSGLEKPFRQCQNNQAAHVCNWMIAAGQPQSFCASCALTEVIPDLSNPANPERWYKIEAAKRRCIYTLLQLRLPMEASAGGAPALRFRFLGNTPSKEPIKTGHQNGVIILNIAEADEDEREKRRLQFHEPYRTLVGHFRHEIGHYYWDRLIRGTARLERFRQLFGDERADYGAALENYYRTGPAPDRRQRLVTAYAGAHPGRIGRRRGPTISILLTPWKRRTASACGWSPRPPRGRRKVLTSFAGAG